MLIRSTKAKNLPPMQRMGGGKTNAKVPYVRTRMEHSPQQAGLCSLSDYQVARYYAKLENSQLFGMRGGVLGDYRVRVGVRA